MAIASDQRLRRHARVEDGLRACVAIRDIIQVGPMRIRPNLVAATLTTFVPRSPVFGNERFKPRYGMHSLVSPASSNPARRIERMLTVEQCSRPGTRRSGGTQGRRFRLRHPVYKGPPRRLRPGFGDRFRRYSSAYMHPR